MCLHFVLVLLIVFATFFYTFSTLSDGKVMLISTTTYLCLNTVSAFLWAFIMAQVSTKKTKAIPASPVLSDKNSFISESVRAKSTGDMVLENVEYQNIDYEVFSQHDETHDDFLDRISQTDVASAAIIQALARTTSIQEF